MLLLLRDTAGTAASGPLPAEEVAAQLRALLGGLQAPVEVAATTQVRERRPFRCLPWNRTLRTGGRIGRLSISHRSRLL